MRRSLDALRQDLTFAFRQLQRSPGFTLVALGSLAIGIGANVAIYGLARSTLQRPPNAARADELVRIYRGEHSPLPKSWFLHFAENTATLRALIAEDPMPVGLHAGATTERVRASIVSENFFPVLGVTPAAGSFFSGQPGEPIGAVAVLSHAFWQARFGGDPSVIGQTVRLNDQPFTILGVAREGFRSSQLGWAPALFVPMSHQDRLRGLPEGTSLGSSFYITGRLGADRTVEQAASELLALAATLPDTRPELSQAGAFRVEQARGVTAELRMPMTMASAFLMAVVGLVLLIACANLANLLLARAVARRPEMAIRTALGVTRGRLVRQLLTESTLVAILAGGAGLGLAWYAARLIPALVPAQAELAFDVAIDANVLVFATVLALATGVLSGLAPALRASRADVQQMLREQGQGGRRTSRLRSAFLVGQVAMATLLLVTAARFLTSLGQAQAIDPGFDSERVVDLQLDLSVRQYDADRGQTFYRQVLENVGSLPGVEAASMIRFIPLGGSNSGTAVWPASADVTDRAAARGITFTIITPGYLEMFGIPVVRGRAFTEADAANAPPVVVVSESFARMMWPGGEAVGQTIRFDATNAATVIGVARDIKYLSLGDQNVPFLYLPLAQAYSADMVLQVRVRDDVPALHDAIRSAVQALDPGLPLATVRSMHDDMAISLLPARAGAGFLAGFGVLALLLATIGVYGVTAFLVGQRTREIGVRTALGATGSNVLRLMMRETLVLVTTGLVLGLVGSIGVGALLSSWLYGVGAFDPRPLVGAGGVLLTVALLGTWLPARRALLVSPVTALRSS